MVCGEGRKFSILNMIPNMEKEEDLSSRIASLELDDFPSLKIKLGQYFTEWLLSEGESALSNYLKKPERLNVPEISQPIVINQPVDKDATDHSSILSKSPKKRTQSEMLQSQSSLRSQSLPPREGNSSLSQSINFMDANQADDANSELSTVRRRSNVDSIPRFYIKGQQGYTWCANKIEEDQLSRRLPEIENIFKQYPAGIPVDKFVHVTKKLYGVPSFFNLPLCHRIRDYFGDESSREQIDRSSIKMPALSSNLSSTVPFGERKTTGVVVQLKTFLKFWKLEAEPYTKIERFFRAIKQPHNNYISKDDFVPFIQELLHFHPGLDFLSDHEEFQLKYTLTVITRIFYKVNTSLSGKITLKELRNSNLFQEFMHVDVETDINKVTEYFSYEHFYVLYCRFFELDLDKDSRLTREDLLRYNEGSLSDVIVQRMFQVGTRVFSDGCTAGYTEDGMGYADFIYFMLAEEDRSTITALKYWFTCCDLDGDGRLTPEELLHFYQGQLRRVVSLGQDSIQFADVLCQMIDLVSPENARQISVDDLIKPEKRAISGILFDVLLNVHKFLRFETRDPFQEKLKREDTFQCDWDRFVYFEYRRLAAEEESGSSAYEEEDGSSSGYGNVVYNSSGGGSGASSNSNSGFGAGSSNNGRGGGDGAARMEMDSGNGNGYSGINSSSSTVRGRNITYGGGPGRRSHDDGDDRLDFSVKSEGSSSSGSSYGEAKRSGSSGGGGAGGQRADRAEMKRSGSQGIESKYGGGGTSNSNRSIGSNRATSPANSRGRRR